MALIDELAEKLAAEVMQAQFELGVDRLYVEVGNHIGTSSPSLQEAFNTACRLHISAQRGRDFFDQRVAALRAAKKDPKS